VKIKSFGCSFVFGSELPDTIDAPFGPSAMTWPALMAKQQGWDYQCCAWPGRGNLYIADEICEHSQAEYVTDVIFIVNWTWTDRFDYFSADRDQWQSILPNDRGSIQDLYHRHLHSQKRDKLVSLMYMQAAIGMLQDRGIPFVMTSMDPILHETQWHSDAAIAALQKKVLPCLDDFQGENFLDWSRGQGYAVSDLWHPMTNAHAAACELMTPVMLSRLKK
jgi:hypothetical protein